LDVIYCFSCEVFDGCMHSLTYSDALLYQVCAAPLLVTPGDQRRRQSTPACVCAASVDQLRAVDAAAAVWLPAACVIQVHHFDSTSVIMLLSALGVSTWQIPSNSNR